jgi:undecaprenyl-diphosphatase
MDETAREYLQSSILALIQGAAELLPVSSSAHVIFAESLMGIDPSSPRATFLLVMLHTGTMGAVLVYFWPRWKKLLFSSQVDGARRVWLQFVSHVVLATLATVVVGYGLKKLIEVVILERMLGHEKGEVELLFKQLPLVGGALLVAGLVIIAAGYLEGRARPRPLSAGLALMIGLIQAFCLPFRGLSRSGVTISAGLFSGLSRELAEDFSFALAVALTPGVIVVEAARLLRDQAFDVPHLMKILGPSLAGMVLSFLAGLVALHLLSAALEKGRWRYFGYYCLAAALVVLVYASTVSTA